MKQMYVKYVKYMIVKVIVFLSTCVFYASGDRYACYPNGTISINNPNSTIYNGVIATYNDGSNVHLCSVSGLETVLISNCNLTFVITVVFSDRSDVSDNIKGGTQVQSFTLKCNEITDHTIAALTGALGITLPVTAEGPVTPVYSIAAGFYDQNSTFTGSPTYSASVGDVIYFIMTGPVEYYLRPIECIAYDNPSKGASTSNKTLITSGCTTDNKLMGDFSRASYSSDFEYWSTFFVFKFYQSSDIFLECVVKVCPQADSCQINCDGSGRKRRDASAYEGLTGEDSRLATIGRRLRITERVLGGSSQIHGSIGLCALLAAVVLTGTFP